MSDFEKIVYTGLVSAVVSTVVALSANRMNFNSKKKEIKLSSYHKDKIEAVKMLYGLIVDLNYINTFIYGVYNGQWKREVYKSELSRWLSAFNELVEYYNKNRILLLEKTELSNKVRDNLNQLSPLRKAVYEEYMRLIIEEEQSSCSQEYSYDDPREENQAIIKRISSLKANSNVANIINSFDIIRDDLEIYFQTLVS